jgi:hypothetical protein
MMAGAAIFGILTAVSRLPAVGAVIRYISVGVDFSLKEVHGQDVLKHKAQVWYAGSTGRTIGFVMLIALAVACFLLARLGAKWMLAESRRAAADSGEGPGDAPKDEKAKDPKDEG